MRMCILTTVWRRPDLTRQVLNWYRSLQLALAPRLDLVLLAVGSEGELSRDLVEGCGWNYMEAPNAPLGGKWNIGFLGAKELDPDAVMIVGSDDVVDRHCVEAAASAMEHSTFFGLLDLWFLDVGQPPRIGYWSGYTNHRVGEPHGVCRTYGRELLGELSWSPWAPSALIDRGLDRAAYVSVCGAKSSSIFTTKLSCIEGVAIDIKTKDGGNICAWNSFEYARVLRDNSLKEFMRPFGNLEQFVR